MARTLDPNSLRLSLPCPSGTLGAFTITKNEGEDDKQRRKIGKHAKSRSTQSVAQVRPARLCQHTCLVKMERRSNVVCDVVCSVARPVDGVEYKDVYKWHACPGSDQEERKRSWAPTVGDTDGQRINGEIE